MLIKDEILTYCKYYHDEVINPFTDSELALLWMAEKFVCEDGARLIDERNIKKSIYDIVYAYVGKWNPYKVEKIMSGY